MADNTALNLGTGGDTIRTDDLTTAKAQCVKLITGAANTDGGVVTTSNPYPVRHCDGSGHNMPGGDAAARPIFVEISSGSAAATFGGDGLTTANTIAMAHCNSNGATLDVVRTPKVFKTQAAVSVASEATLWTPTSGKKFRLMGFDLAGDQAGTYTFKDNTAGTTIYVGYFAANTPRSVNLGNGILSAVANNVFTCTGPASSHVTGTIWGTEE